MRILMFNNEFPPLGGGTGVVNRYLLQEWKHTDDVSVDLVTSMPYIREMQCEQLSERIRIHKVPVGTQDVHHATNRELMRYARHGLSTACSLMQQHNYDMSFAWAGVPAGAISYALHLRYNLPYLLTLRGPDIPGFETRYNYLYPVLKPLLRRIWNAASEVTVTSEENRQLVCRTLPQLLTSVIHNGVDTNVFRPSQKAGNQDIFHMLCVGRLIERKGQHHLLQAVAKLKQQLNQRVRLTLVGNGDSEDTLRSMVTALGLDENVVFAGYVPHVDVHKMYADADVFVLPSEHEGMSNALLEALASGLPVVVTDTGGTKELVADDQNGFVSPWGNDERLSQILAKLANDAPLRLRMGEKSRSIAKNFAWSAVSRIYLELCRKIATQRTSVAAVR